MLVKLEKEIELEESLMLTEEPPPVVKTFSVCCQHGGLYQSGVGPDPGRRGGAGGAGRRRAASLFRRR